MTEDPKQSELLAEPANGVELEDELTQTRLVPLPYNQKAVRSVATSPGDLKTFHIVIIPNAGDMTVESYHDKAKGVHAMYTLFRAKDAGKFKGEIIAFVGKCIRYTNMVPAMRIDVPDFGEFELSDHDQYRYISDDVVDPEVTG